MKSLGECLRKIWKQSEDYNCPSFPIIGFLSIPSCGLERDILNWMRDRSSDIQTDRLF